MKSKSIVFKLSVYIISMVTLILSGLLILNYRTTKRLMMQNINYNIGSVLQKSIDDITQRAELLQDITQRYSFAMMQRMEFEDSATIDFLSSVTKEDSLILGSSILLEPELSGQSKDILYHYSKGTDSSFIVDYEGVPDDRLLLKSNGFWSDPYYHELYKSYVSSFSTPFYYANKGTKSIIGFLKVDIQIKWLEDIVSEMKVYETGRTFIVTQNGQFVTPPEKQFLKTDNFQDFAKSYNNIELNAILDSIMQMKSGYTVISDLNEDLEDNIFTYNQLLDNGWFIISQFRVSEHLKELLLITRKAILFGSIGILLIFIVCYSIIYNITRPIRQLATLTEDIRNGNFNVIVPDSDKQDETGKLAASIIAIQSELKKYIKDLTRIISEKERIESDIRIASEIQANMIPSTFPAPDELKGIDIFGRIIPAKLISGDLFDFRRIDENKVYFLIGDVTGKGVPASLFMAMTRVLVIAESKRESNPERIVQAVNNQLCENNKASVFVTAIFGVVDIGSGEIEYCNAGHNYPILITETGSTKVLDETHGLPLGLFPDQSYKTSKTTLSENGYLCTFSDGVIEAENTKGLQYGEEKLEMLLKENAKKGKSSKELANISLDDVEAFIGKNSPTDDITILILSKST